MLRAPRVGRLRRGSRAQRRLGNLLEVLLDNVDVAVVACGLDGRPTHINRRAVELMGMDGSNGSEPETWTSQVWPRTPDGEKLALEELPIVRALRGEVVRDFDLLVRTERGDVLMNTTANPVFDESGERLGAVAIFADVTAQRTEERRVQEELRSVDLAYGVQEALAAGRLEMYAQPIIAPDDRRGSRGCPHAVASRRAWGRPRAGLLHREARTGCGRRHSRTEDLEWQSRL